MFRIFNDVPADGSAGLRYEEPLQTASSLNALLEQVRALGLRDICPPYANLPSAGEFDSSNRGRGLDFEEVRAYTPGDNVRDMDWRTTARRGKPYVKRYRESRQQTVCVIVDRGASMRFGTRRQLKVVQAVRIAAAYVYAFSDHGACIGGVLYDKHPVASSCRPGMPGAVEWLHHAIQPCPPLDGVSEVRLSALYAAIASVAPRGTQLLWLSDFNHLGDAAKPLLAQLSQRYAIHALRIADAAELALPSVGVAPFGAAGDPRWLNTDAPATQAAFAAAIAGERARVAELFAAVGVRLDECTTDDDAALVAARVLSRRRAGR